MIGSALQDLHQGTMAAQFLMRSDISRRMEVRAAAACFCPYASGENKGRTSTEPRMHDFTAMAL